MTNYGLNTRHDIWFLVSIVDQCLERSKLIREENNNTDERLESLIIILHDVINKMSKLQETSDEGISFGHMYYQSLIKRI